MKTSNRQSPWNRGLIGILLLTALFGFASTEPLKAQTSLQVVNDWGSGFEGLFSVVNTGNSAIDDWRLEFDFDHTISSIWSAEVEQHNGLHYVIKPPAWNKILPAGGTVTFGFIGTPGNGVAAPRNIVLRSNTGSDTTQPDTTPPESVTVDIGDICVVFAVKNDWTSGYQGQISIQNNGTQSVSGWQLSFELGSTINSLWNGKLTVGSDSQYTVSPSDWKLDISSGETVSFGFVAAPGGTSRSIANIAFNGIPQTAPDEPTPDDPAPDDPTPDDPTPDDPAPDDPTPDDPTPGDPAPDDPAPGDPAPGDPAPGDPAPGDPTPVEPTEFIICGYFPEWGIYARDYYVMDIPAEKLNVINYAFADIDENGEVSLFDSWAAVEKSFAGDTWDQPLKGNFNQLRQLKALYPHLITMISIGGWTLSGRFSDVALSDNSRQKFASSAVEFIIEYGFDGIDIDWEYPVSGGLASNTTRPEDKQNYTLLLQEIRRQLDALSIQQGRAYYLTIAAPAGYQNIVNLEPAEIAATVDWINLMTYDFHGGWETTTGHHSPLFGGPGDLFTSDSAVQIYINAGVPARQLVLGTPFYGRSWDQVPDVNNGLYQTAGGVPMGTWDETGMFDYWDIISLATEQPDIYRRYWDTTANVPFIYAPTVSGGMFITYEDTESVKDKAAYVRKMGLGGMMFWELSGDTQDESTSLLSAIHTELAD